MLNHSFDEMNLYNKTQDSFAYPIMKNENMTDLEREQAMTKISMLEEEAILSYEELLQCAIASEDTEMISLIQEITDDERKHVGNILKARQVYVPDVYDQIEQGTEELTVLKEEADIEDNLNVEEFFIVEKDGNKWKTLASAKNLNEARTKYNKNLIPTKERRLITLKDLKDLKRKSESFKANEAPADAKSLFTALMSELNVLYNCKITDQNFLRCTNDEGNFIEVAYIEDTDPVQLGMKVTFTDGTESETNYYIYDSINATSDFITAVFIGELNAKTEEDFNSAEEENLEKDIDDVEKELNADDIKEDVDTEEKELEEDSAKESLNTSESLEDDKEIKLAIAEIKKYYDEDELAINLDPLKEEFENRGLTLSEDKYQEIITDLGSGITLEQAVDNAFYGNKDECGTVADLGTAPIMPVGSSIFPKKKDEDEDKILAESLEDQEKEFENLMSAAVEDDTARKETAKEWVENAISVLNNIEDEKVKDNLHKKYDAIINKYTTESNANINKVVKDLAESTNAKTTPADELAKLYDINNDTAAIYRINHKSEEPLVPMIFQNIMNDAVLFATNAFIDPKSLETVYESFKHIDRKSVEDFIKSDNLGGLVKYLYESAIKNEDTFINPQMNNVNPSINTTASGNDPETPKLADDIDPAPTEVQGFPKDKSEIENTQAKGSDINNPITKNTNTEDILTK